MPTGNPMSPEAERRLYLEGIRLFNAHEYFEAHEVWEELWHAATGHKHDFYQGLIQAAVALEHYRRSNPQGVIHLAERYSRHLRRVPPKFMGLDIPRFLDQMAQALRPVLSASPVPQRGQIVLDLATAPQIVLEKDTQ